MRTPKEIETEIAALRECLGYAPKRNVFGDNNHAAINAQIDYLTGKLDITAPEFEEEDQRIQESVLQAQAWKDGDEDESPSFGWKGYKPK